MRNWKGWLALALAIGLGCLVIFDFDRVKSDLWPVDRSFIAPNIVASLVQWAVILIAAALLWPPTRRAIHRYVTGHVDSIKAHATSEAAKIHERIDHTHARIDAIHEHLGITPKAPESLLEAPMTPVKPKRVRKIVPKL